MSLQWMEDDGSGCIPSVPWMTNPRDFPLYGCSMLQSYAVIVSSFKTIAQSFHPIWNAFASAVCQGPNVGSYSIALKACEQGREPHSDK